MEGHPDDEEWPRLFDVPRQPWEGALSAREHDDTDPGDELLFPVVPDDGLEDDDRWGGGRILGRFGFGRAEE